METNLKVGITGSSGFIGKNLSEALISEGHRVIPLPRGFSSNNLGECDVVINLAGASINQRWTKNNREKILGSRVETTKKITEYINNNTNISLLINASAVGIYGNNTPESIFTEADTCYGDDFLASVCKQWEEAARSVDHLTRVAIIRLGVVISTKGGALPKMALPAKFGISTYIGEGTQPISWIMLEDVINAILFIIKNDSISGTVNLTSPNYITNREMTSVIARKYKSIFTISIPEVILRIIMGKASEVLTKGQKVLPNKLLKSGFSFTHPFFSRKN